MIICRCLTSRYTIPLGNSSILGRLCLAAGCKSYLASSSLQASSSKRYTSRRSDAPTTVALAAILQAAWGIHCFLHPDNPTLPSLCQICCFLLCSGGYLTPGSEAKMVIYVLCVVGKAPDRLRQLTNGAHMAAKALPKSTKGITEAVRSAARERLSSALSNAETRGADDLAAQEEAQVCCCMVAWPFSWPRLCLKLLVYSKMAEASSPPSVHVWDQIPDECSYMTYQGQ